MAAVVSVAGEATPAEPLYAGSLLRGDDYPMVSIEEEQEGTVAIRLKINEKGHVTSCDVVQSSGHAPLDEQTCAIYRARAQFRPALDGRGRPVTGSYRQRVTWRLTGDKAPLLPRHAWKLLTTLGFSADGALAHCSVSSTGLSTMPNGCEETKAIVAEATGNSRPAESADLPVVFSLTEAVFYPQPVQDAPVPPPMVDATVQARQVSEISIAPDGTISGCVGKTYERAASPDVDACGLIGLMEFEPDPEQDGPVTGTLVVTAYMRQQSIS